MFPCWLDIDDSEDVIKMVSGWTDAFEDCLFCWVDIDDIWTAAFNDQIQTMQNELSFLKIFTLCWENGARAAMVEAPSAIKAIEVMSSLAGIAHDIDDIFMKCCDVECEDTETLILQASDMFLEKLQYYKPVLKEILLEWSDLSLESKCFSKHHLKDLLAKAVQNLKDLLVLKPDMIAPVKKQIGAVEKRLECVSAIFHFASRDEHVDQLNSFFNHIQDWANSAAAVPFLYWVDETDERVNAMVSTLMQKFKPCTLELAELYLGALKALKPSKGPDFSLRHIAVARFVEILQEDLVVPTDDGFEILQDVLLFFISFFLNPPREHAEIGKLISKQSSLCVNKAASLICSLFASNSKEDIAKGSKTFFHELLEKMNQAQAEIRELHLEIPAPSRNIFPRTNIQGFLEIFFRNLNEKGNDDAALTTYRRHELMTLQKELLALKPLIMRLFHLHNETEELKDLQMRISRMAYFIDYVMDSFLLHDPTDYWHSVICLSYVAGEIQFIKNELGKSKNTENSGGIQLPAQVKNTTTEDVIVGLENEAERVINYLTGGLPQLNIVAIVGMPGQGKTTLAKKLYRDDRVLLRFQKYAWCCISQAYQIENILISILKDVNPTLEEDDIVNKTHEELAEMLYRCLKGRPYLIVLDDIWDVGPWKELKASFPDDKNGSRILFTSRIHTVALEANPDCSLHELHPLSPKDSFELLRQKLSYRESFPLNLLKIGRQIAEYCKGLPLAIVVIAGLLAKADGIPAFWEQIARSLKSLVAREGCMNVLELSYRHLPDYLKPCFLYLAAFKEDEPILAKKLTRYWIAEGFIPKHENKSLEDVANEYLKDLAGRSLLSVAKRSSRFGIKKCVVHDLVRELCLEKGKEENFLLVPNISDSHCFDTMHQSYRLCFHTRCWPSFEPESTAPIARTLIFSERLKHRCGPLFFLWFKVLRVLDLLCINIESDIDGIVQLVHLRYLALSGTFFVPSAMVNLSKLEFLMLNAEGSDEFPKTIWNMRNLRHLYLINSGVKYMHVLIGESSPLDHLETFSSLYCSWDLEEFKWLLRRIPNVRKLKIFLEFPVRLSEFLNKLESLHLSIRSTLSFVEFELPSTLRKLTMEGASLPANTIAAIGKLPNLEVLKLKVSNFDDQRWDVEDDEFFNLKYLKLTRSYIEEWNVSTDAFPQLQQLILKSCYRLAEVPCRFGVLPTMKVMKVSCCRELIASVREIIAEQQDLGDFGLQITTDFPVEE